MDWVAHQTRALIRALMRGLGIIGVFKFHTLLLFSKWCLGGQR